MGVRSASFRRRGLQGGRHPEKGLVHLVDGRAERGGAGGQADRLSPGEPGRVEVGRPLNVESVTDTDNLHKEHVLLCKEVV